MTTYIEVQLQPAAKLNARERKRWDMLVHDLVQCRATEGDIPRLLVITAKAFAKMCDPKYRRGPNQKAVQRTADQIMSGLRKLRLTPATCAKKPSRKGKKSA